MTRRDPGGRGPSRARPSASDDRAQLLLVGAFALALLIVSLAVVLNGAAVTETLASDRGEGAAPGALAFERDVWDAVAGLVVAVNHEGHATTGELDAAIAEAVDDWETAAGQELAVIGTSATVDLQNGTTYGSRIAQTNDSRRFENASGAADWTLATGVTDTRGFRMNLSRGVLANATAPDPFTVVATNGTATWRASFAANGSTIVATVDRPNGTETCRVDGDWVVVHLSAGTVGGEECPALEFPAGLGGTYDVAFENASAAAGTYDLVVDVSVADDGRYSDTGDPSVWPAIDTVRVEISYDGPQVNYGTELVVRPGDDSA